MSGIRAWLATGAVVLSAACASTGGPSAAGGGDRLLLEAEELRLETAARSLEEVIRRRRPHWLTSRGPTTLRGTGGEVVVYLDGVAVGGPAALETVAVETVASARFLNAAEATTRFGTGHTRGAILVVTRRR